MDTELKEQFEKMDKRFDAIIQNMVTKTDMQEMRSELADKNDINNVLTAVDGIAKQMNDYNQELPAIQQQLKNINDWIAKAGPKIGLPYKG